VKITITYVHKKDHRDKSPQKAQWTISEQEERSCFKFGMESSWNIPVFVSWGLHLDNEAKASNLGTTALDTGEVIQSCFAKFRDDDKKNEWHGYPADHRKNQDRPPLIVLNSWKEKNYLPKAKISKIQRGKKFKI